MVEEDPQTTPTQTPSDIGTLANYISSTLYSTLYTVLLFWYILSALFCPLPALLSSVARASVSFAFVRCRFVFLLCGAFLSALIKVFTRVSPSISGVFCAPYGKVFTVVNKVVCFVTRFWL